MKDESIIQERRPVIGLTPYHNPDSNAAAVSLKYIDCIIKSGGTPIILPNMADAASIDHAVSLCDGVIFTGGYDVNPALYGEMPIWTLGPTSPMNDQNDPMIFKAAFGRKLPIMGICRGIQILTVLLGGALYQDLGVQFHPEGMAAQSEGAMTMFSKFIAACR